MGNLPFTMNRRHARHLAFPIVLGLSLVLSGCHGGDGEKEPNWATDQPAYTPRDGSENAFDGYALAALDAESRARSNLDRVSYFPDQKSAMCKLLAPCIKRVAQASKHNSEFKFVPHRPFRAASFQAGWRLMGRVFQWNTETACLAGDYDTAISQVTIGTKFAFDLTGGGATDASLGLSIANDLRRAISSQLNKLSPTQLDRLARGIKNAMVSKPGIADTLKNEHQNMLLSLQTVYDALKSDDLKSLVKQMGPDVNEAVRHLEDLRSNDKKRSEFLTELTTACEDEFKAVQEDIGKPYPERSKPPTELKNQWKKLPKHILGTIRPLVQMDDATVARTKLLVLYAEIIKLGKEHKPYPDSLSVFTKELTVDPFSNAPFLYHADQAEFLLYSVGANGRDDGGDTDETFTSPDLRLEVSNL